MQPAEGARMIPKIIHYCWFGRGPKPADAVRFIEGWKRLHPDYRFIEWNEDNFDVGCCAYVRQAYERRKFAFVSDYARGKALLEMGGVYLDTDVELLAKLDPFLQHEAFLGFEEGNQVATSTIGCRPGHPIVRAYLSQYNHRSFIQPDGSLDMTTNVVVLNRILVANGMRPDGSMQTLPGGTVCYPKQYFSPLDYVRFIDHRDVRTVAVHHYQHTWGGPLARAKKHIARGLSRLVGPSAFAWLRRCRTR